MQKNHNYNYTYLYLNGKIIPIMIDKDWEIARIKEKVESKVLLEKLKELTPKLN